MELSFGEQIRILLNRRNMTIKDLADLYTQSTGQPMSRQNLTQRLKRDNFPEQDMYLIASLLGCRVSIRLEPTDTMAAEYLWPSSKGAPHPVPENPDREEPHPEAVLSLSPQKTAMAAEPERTEEPALSAGPERTAGPDLTPEPALTAEPEPGDGAQPDFRIPDAFRKAQPQGDINPLTGEEYLTNTVRRHPRTRGYLQVYDRSIHEWSDVRENYFWDFQNRKKQMLGTEYRPPIQI